MKTSDLTDHISRRFNADLEELRNSVLKMGGLVETQLSKAISAIVSGDSALGLKVANDDYKVNALEVAIDEECSRILATRAPAAGDLRGARLGVCTQYAAGGHVRTGRDRLVPQT